MLQMWGPTTEMLIARQLDVQNLLTPAIIISSRPTSVLKQYIKDNIWT
jgi:hypothetical protein